MSKQSRIVIIGSGVFGLSAAYHLATKGYENITVLDRGEYDSNQYSPLKGADAASTDLNKLVRASYVDKVHYQNLALESLGIYNEWNQQLQSAKDLPKGLKNDEPVFANTGYARLDNIEHDEEKKTLANFAKYGLRAFEYGVNDPEDIKRAKVTGWFKKLDPLGQRNKSDIFNGVLDSLAGVVLADKALLWVRYLTEQTGNAVFINGSEKGAVQKILYDGDKAVGVETKDGVIHEADLVVLAAGGWTPSFYPKELSPYLECQASTYVTVQIPKDRLDLIAKYQDLPQINWRMTYESNFREDAIYAFPATRDGIFKVGANDHFWRNFNTSDSAAPLSVPQTPLDALPTRSLNTYQKFFSEWCPDLVAAGLHIENWKICYSAVGAENEFLIDYIPGYKNVIVSSGGGFHGFKFLPVIGRFVEGLVSGKQYEYSTLFRFESKKKPIAAIRDPTHPHSLSSVEFTPATDGHYKISW
ncbi:hypothetical protein OGAPHI_001358 [Ogataea philodendri]|uniref:FAD dependent oxidoreductase domain-containing protein n=1 Tax=Ogataea philodendri TaxID=1378263 RepID=A0A9P8PDD8_9ASCO|nr:uncharacterized protein OGAPHI_001358 [Ogataea philodendri]KAH3669237.1 hypothetical protein OGAPHI_001358 [Ogataea philodendri]